MSANAIAEKKSHPKGLYLLFATEAWERWNYYGMRALLVLYMLDKVKGLGWSHAHAYDVYGWFTGVVYVTPLIGGYLADRYIGQQRAVIIGGITMMVGQFLLASPGPISLFYLGLVVIVLGNGFFKPNISTMVGGLYPPRDPRRDGAFSIFYMGINLGAFVAPLVTGYLQKEYSFHYGFLSAGVGMAFGMVTFFLLRGRLLGDVGLRPVPRPAARDAASSHSPLTKEEKDRILSILIICLFVTLFFAAFEQAGGLMNVYTNEKVNRAVFGWEVPAAWFQSINSIFILLLAPIFAAMWTFLSKHGKDPSIPRKMGLGLLLLSSGFVLMMGAARQSNLEGKASAFWVIGAYFLQTCGELALSPVGLSMISKLAPKRLTSLFMGVFFVFIAVGNYSAALIGKFADKLGELQAFGFTVVFTAVAGLILVAIANPLRKLMHGADETEAEVQPPSEGSESKLPQSSAA